jgi:MinD superfamily P-loop ATPase
LSGSEHGGDRLPEVPTLSPWATGPDQWGVKTTAELIDRLRSEYERVIIAAPPVLSTMGAAAMEHADRVILVLSIGETRWRDLRRAAENVQAMARLTGAVLTGKYHSSGRIRWGPVVSQLLDVKQ